MSEARKKLAEIKAMSAKRDELLTELDHALKIQEMIPTAFDNGSVRIKWLVGMAPYPSRDQEIKGGTLIDGNGLEHPLPADAAERLGVTAQDMKEEWKVSR
jgi:hypothetical protein